MHWQKRVRDYLVYTLTSLVVVGLVLFEATRGANENLLLNLFGAFMFTGLTFGFVAEQRKSLLHRRPFAITFWAILGIHLAVVCFLLYRRVLIPGAGWFAIAIAELLVLLGIRGLVIKR